MRQGVAFAEAACTDCGFRVRWTGPWEDGTTDLDAGEYRRQCKHQNAAKGLPRFDCPKLTEAVRIAARLAEQAPRK